MVLNWNIEVILDFIFSFIILITAFVSFIAPKTKKITSLFYFRLVFLAFSVFFVFDGLSILFISPFFSRISGIILLPLTLLVIISINYTFREDYYSLGLIIFCGLGVLLVYVGLQPDSVGVSTYLGYPRIDWRGLFNILGILFSGVVSFYLLYWGTKTYLKAPFLIKKDATILFLGILFASVLGMLFYFLYVFEPVYILFSNLSIIIGLVVFTIAIIREPKLLYILPFTVFRIVVKDREGRPLFDHDWSESNISERIFTGFLNAVQLMSEEVMHIGGLLDINLEEGILILKESDKTTVGLVASKSSKLLRDSVVSFTTAFEKKFDRELKASVSDMSAYEPAYELIEKYFSNFPYKIIKNKKQPLLLSGKYLRIPPELDNKLRSVITDEKEYEAIKAELIKSPLSMPSDFFKSYSEMKEELEQISGKETKYLDTDSNEDK
ncbi:MAG: hypothetical protein KGD58_04750 [Candidatus Lokiarchaeota archaeon]|nr:hypothetical protein [Candidatus Lokiarchaeota archaeon]